MEVGGVLSWNCLRINRKSITITTELIMVIVTDTISVVKFKSFVGSDRSLGTFNQYFEYVGFTVLFVK